MKTDEISFPAALDVLFSRRSTAQLTEPGPTTEQLNVILRAATTAPDHGNLMPYRFIVASGTARHTVGQALAASAKQLRPELTDDQLANVAKKAFVAPTMILLVAAPDPTAKVEVWEQVATAACTGFAIALAAHALGLGAIWKSVPFTQGVGLTDSIGLATSEQLLGWVNIGTAIAPVGARPPVAIDALVTYLPAG